MRILKTLFIFYVVLGLNELKCQPFVDIFNYRYQHYQKVNYKDNSNQKLRIDLSEMYVTVPVVLKNEDVFLAAAGLKNLIFDSDTSSSTLKSLLLQSGYEHIWKNENWKTLAQIIFRMNTDELKDRNNSLQTGGVILISYKKSPSMKFKLGLYYNWELFGNYFIPLAGMDWKINKKTNLYGILPANMNLEYMLSEKYYVGISYNSITSTYRSHDVNLNYYVREGKKGIGSDQLKFFVNWYAMKKIVIYSEAGFTYFRMFKVYENKKEVLVNNSIYRETDDGLFISLGIAYRIRPDY